MKKNIINILVALFAAVGFSACTGEMELPPMVYPDLNEASAGNGSAAKPYTVGAAINAIVSHNYTSRSVFIKGIVTEVDGSAFDPTYGNLTYYISDEGESYSLEVYRGSGLNGAKFADKNGLKVGDEVIIYGKMTYYNDKTPEITQGSIIVSLNGSDYIIPESVEPEGDGSSMHPFNAVGALDACYSDNIPVRPVYVKGIVCKIDELDTGNNGNATFYIQDEGNPYDQFEIYRCYGLNGKKFTSADELKVGDEVVAYGIIVLYNGNTAEMTQGGMLLSVNGSPYDKAESVAPAGEGTPEEPYNVSGILNAYYAGDLTTGTEVYVKGTVCSVSEVSTTYGNATYYISDSGLMADFFYIYHGYGLNGEKFNTSNAIKVGDKVVICGTLGVYSNKPQLGQGNKIVSINPEEPGDDAGETQE